MDWNQIGQGVAIGFSAAVPAVVGLAWAVRRVFNLAVWKETLATKKDLAAHRAETKEELAAHRAEVKEELAAHRAEVKEELAAHRAETKEDIAALQEANEAAHAGINARIDSLQTDVDELKSTVASLATTVAGLVTTVASLVTSVDTLRSDMGRVLDHLLGSQSK